MGRPKDRNEYRREMAEAFARVLEEKGLAWRKEWKSGAGSAPRNGVTNACYRGSNAFWLGLVSLTKGYTDPRWVTMVQIMDREARYHPKEKWHLRSGSKAAWVEYWYPYDRKERKALTLEQYGREIRNGRDSGGFLFSTRYTAVFNACDVEGMPALTEPEREAFRTDELVRRLSEGMGVPVRTDGGDQAWYSPYEDAVHLPVPGAFDSEYAFNATALHELAHATGHPARLDRPQTSAYGTPQYAYEELVAEMSSCFMGFGLQAVSDESHIANHRAYVQAWVRSIREQPDSLIRAIRDARTAAGYMDWKAGLISEREYENGRDRSFELPDTVRERER